MNVYDSLITKTEDIIKANDCKVLKLNPDVDWPLLEDNEFLMGKEVAYELGDRFKTSAVYNLCTSNKDLIDHDEILLIGKDLNEIKENTNFSRVTIFNIDDIKDQNKAYLKVKKLDYDRFKMIPKGYMVLSSTFESKENVRVAKDAIKKGLNFEILGNLYINHYKKISGVNNVKVVFIVGDYPFLKDLADLGKLTYEVTDAFDHILKNVILDCDVCPLNKICDQIEELRLLHFESAKRDTK